MSEKKKCGLCESWTVWPGQDPRSRRLSGECDNEQRLNDLSKERGREVFGTYPFNDTDACPHYQPRED